MLGVIQSALLLVGPDAQRDDAVYQKIERIAEGEDSNDNTHQRNQMANEDGRIAVNQPHFFGKNPSEHHAHQTADTMAGEDVERFINGKALLEPDGPIAYQ